MSNPNWGLIAQLGDADPVEHGGYFIFVDQNGEHEPRGEFWEVPDDESEPAEIFRWSLTKCTYQDGVLSDNQFHPEIPAWFADSVADAAECCDYQDDIIADLCGDDVLARARAYETIGHYAGFRELDEYPLELSSDALEQLYEKHIALAVPADDNGGVLLHEPAPDGTEFDPYDDWD